ncbi:MAG: plasmid mobilization relaxosome protein MobC [Candidatus Pedobacter colombiensis]|uniref:Plasmid mobilization relaxosome protein MobC n=1 Tax=Candidatus Pedobacter colombiensis TaxID=3121371 RepID=A0AAJ5W6C9_9SPHI|nr:plasmid mobilization relaxosome protein MobC [Pedobacter sp.]WEK17953.1 MAG: plasmid mobilization relaxosome protein MobC [Pedobacter sp.]
MKEQKNNRIKLVQARLTLAEEALLIRHFKSTTERKLSAYVRSVMLAKPLIKAVRNESLNDIIKELYELRKDLSGVANNFNQAIHKLHTLSTYPEIKAWLLGFEINRKAMQKSIEEIKLYINKTSDKWLQS